MLLYKSPRITVPTWEDFVHHTRNIEESSSIAEGITLNFRALRDKYIGNNSQQGRAFEASVYDGIVRSGVPISRVLVNTSANKYKEANFDIIIPPSDLPKLVVLTLKTSFRERWRIADWDALAAWQYRHALPGFQQGVQLEVYALFFSERERPEDKGLLFTRDAAMREARKLQDGVLSPLIRFIPVLDYQRTDDFLASLSL